MDDDLITDLQYGHVGDATLIFKTTNLEKDLEWQVEKQPKHKNFLSLGDAQIFCDPIEEPDDTVHHTTRDSEVTRATLARLAECYPEIGGAEDVLAEMYLAEFAEENEAVGERIQGDLLVFCFAIPVFDQKSRLTQSGALEVVAHVHGKHMNEIRLLEVRDERRGWDYTISNDKSVWLETKDLTSEVTASWTSSGGEILQLSSSYNAGFSLLGSRSRSSVSIFSPRWKATTAPSRTVLSNLECSQIAFNHLIDIDLRQLSYPNCVDIAFSSIYANRMSTMDAKGNWFEWTIDGDAYSRKHSATVVSRGCLGKSRVSAEEPDGRPGWHKHVWMREPLGLIASSRSTLQVFDLQDRNDDINDVVGSQMITLGKEDYLDIRRRADTQDVVVLGSSHVFLYQYRKQPETETKALKLVWKMSHFRDSCDLSLNLALIDPYEATIHSRYTSTITHVHLGVVAPSDLDDVTCATSNVGYICDMDAADGHSSVGRHCDLIMWSAPLRNAFEVNAGLGKEYMERKIRFFQMLRLSSRLQLKGEVVIEEEDKKLDGYAVPPLNPQWHEIYVKSTRKKLNRPLGHRDGSFNVASDPFDQDEMSVLDFSDDLESVTESASESSYNSDDSGDHKAWVIPLENAYERLAQLANPPTEPLSQAVRERLDKSTVSGDVKLSHRETLLGLLGTEILAEEVDRCSNLLSKLLEPDGDSSITLPQQLRASLAVPRMLDEKSDAKENLTLSRIYRTLINNWIEPLPESVPARSRIAAERRARDFAGKIMLSAILVDPVQTAASQVSGDFQSSPPLLNSPSSSQPASSQLTQRDKVASKPFDTSTVNGALGRLSRYADIRTDITELSESTHEVMAHWLAVDDIKKYDYEDVEARITGEETTTDFRRAEQQAKAARREERHRQRDLRREMKRQRLSSRKADSQSAADRGFGRAWDSSQQASTNWLSSELGSEGAVGDQASGSKVVRGSRAADDSSPSRVNATYKGPTAVASQIESGRFGGRPSFGTRKAKKPQRKAGF